MSMECGAAAAAVHKQAAANLAALPLYHYICCSEPTSWMARFFNLNVPIVASRMPHWPHGILRHNLLLLLLLVALLLCCMSLCNCKLFCRCNCSDAEVCMFVSLQGADQLDGALLQSQRAYRRQPHRHAAAAG
jgi:hypothetical protein